jgi:prepilin signal peptidase PulO-like enzyme (type II secretory pathway)
LPLDIAYPKLLALIVATIGAITDLRTGKIYNKLTFPAAIAGLIVQSVYFGTGASAEGRSAVIGALTGALYAVLGWLVAVVIMTAVKLLLRYAGEFGHGDSKLLGAIGSFIGPGPVLLVFFYYCLSFGAWSLARVLPALPWGEIFAAARTGYAQGIDLKNFRQVGRKPLPVAPFIALGTALAITLEGPTLKFLGLQ